MEERKKTNTDQNNNDLSSSLDEQDLSEVKEIITLFSNTVSSIKIYITKHSTVIKQVDQLWTKLNDYLDKYWKLEIGIRELAFTYKEKTIFQDVKTIKSLPFLFYKDGMQKLILYKGLKKEELQEFLEIIKKVYELPAEEGDIVNLLWERDFANIRYFAPDDFLETKIGAGKKLAEIQVERDALFSGSIELLPEDHAELQKACKEDKIPEQISSEEYDEEKQWKEIEFDEQFSTLTERENRILDAMLIANRRVSPEDELVMLVTEMLNLEEDTERFEEILEAVVYIYHDIIQKGNFTLAHQLLSNVLEIDMFLSYQSDPKERLIDEFLRKLKSNERLDLIKRTVLKGKVEDFRLFLAFLDLLLGPDASALLAELYEKINNKDFRQRTLHFLEESAMKDPNVLVKIAKDSRPELTKEVISILSSIPEKRSIQSLATFIQSKDKTIKTKAIKALGKFKDLTSSKILIGFLNDKDKDVRILAASSLPFAKDDSIVEQVKNLVFGRGFKKKSKEEKMAILAILTKSRIKKAYELLEEILLKPGFFSGSKHTETRLCSIQALEIMGSPESLRILKKGAHSRNRKIREVCKMALQDLSPDHNQER